MVVVVPRSKCRSPSALRPRAGGWDNSSANGGTQWLLLQPPLLRRDSIERTANHLKGEIQVSPPRTQATSRTVPVPPNVLPALGTTQVPASFRPLSAVLLVSPGRMKAPSCLSQQRVVTSWGAAKAPSSIEESPAIQGNHPGRNVGLFGEVMGACPSPSSAGRGPPDPWARRRHTASSLPVGASRLLLHER